MFFTGPIWLSILVPLAFAPVLLISSLAIRPRLGIAVDTSVWLSAAGLALAFLTGGTPLTMVLVGFVLFTHWIGLAIERAAAHEEGSTPSGVTFAQAWLVVAVTSNLTMATVIWRAHLIAVPLRGSAAIVPFGVSYLAFHGIAYVIDVYRRRVPANRSRFQLGLYLMLLPMIVAGPVGYEGIAPHLGHDGPSLSDYSYGVRRLLIGAWKVFVMADLTGRQAAIAFALRPSQLTAFMAWLGLVSVTLQMYYALSGYADMGIGVGRMLGVRLPENFRWPYVAQTVGEFWRRWHLGLSGWFREYADVPRTDDHLPPPAASREAFVSMLCALWYGTGRTFIVWGLYHATLIVLERAGLEGAVKRLPAALRHVYLLAVVLAGWVVFRSETLGGALLFFKALAGLNAAAVAVRPPIAFELWLVLVGGAIGCAPIVQSVRRWTVAIDALILSLLMLLLAPFLFAWRGVMLMAAPVLRWWRVKRA